MFQSETFLEYSVKRFSAFLNPLVCGFGSTVTGMRETGARGVIISII